MISAGRKAELMEAADRLLDARRTATPMVELPAELRPVDIEEVSFVQDTIAVAYEEIGGWKVGAGTADAVPMFAPMPLAWMGPSGSVLVGPMHRLRGLEAEVAFLMGEDLPARETAYTREEVVAAIASCHPAIEVLESGLEDPLTADRMSVLGDLQMHGGFVYGPACDGWQTIDFTKERVTLAVDGVVRADRTGSNTSGDLLRMLPWLANEGAGRTGGLKKGQWVTTGSWTGNTLALAGSAVDVQFDRVGQVSLRFG